MAYHGEIEFLDIPYGKVEWNSRIQLPFEESDRLGRGEGATASFTATTYEYESDVHEGVIYYDEIGTGKENYACIIIGIERGTSDKSRDRHFVLIVEILQERSSLPTCRRAGVGFLLNYDIKWESSELATIE
jgi:hypothetical protein